MIQQHLIPTFLSNSMSCIFIHVSSSAWNALLALPSWEIPGSDIISLVLFSSSLGWVNLCCLCVFSELVLWPLGHSPLFVYMSISPSGQEWVMYGASPWHQHPIWDWPRVGVINIPWVESNWISLLPGLSAVLSPFPLDLGRSLQATQGFWKSLIFSKWSSVHLSTCCSCSPSPPMTVSAL